MQAKPSYLQTLIDILKNGVIKMNTYQFEITDTFGGEANYCWARHYQVEANSLHGALCKVSKETGYNFNYDGARYDAKGCCVCMFDISDNLNTHINFKSI